MVKLINFNRVIKNLIISDLALITGLGLITPIFAIFLTDRIKGANIEVVGFAAAIYWVVESIVAVPFGKFLDKTDSERADLIFVIIGNLLAALSVFGYFFSTLPWHIYFLQGVCALGMGMNIPAYTAIFTRHIDKGREAFTWGVRSSSVAAGSGIAGALGGIIAERYGFDSLFIGVIVFILLSSFLPFLVKKEMKLKDGAIAEVQEMKTIPPNLPK